MLYFSGIDIRGMNYAYAIFPYKKVTDPYHTYLDHNIVMLYFRLTHFHVSNSIVVFST